MTNQNSVIVMPALRRPEMLALALERISQANNAPDDVRIFLDTCPDERLEEVSFVRDIYLPTAEIFRAGEHQKLLSGTWNILHSLQEGWRTGKEYVHFIEEDVLVSRSYFDWAYQTHNSGDYFVVCGRRCGRLPLDFFSNPASTYRHDSLSKVVPHISEAYFDNNEKYLNDHFPEFKGQDGVLDDGLIRKVCKANGNRVKCAEPAVAAHVGFRMYQGPHEYKNTGKNIEERISWIREFLSDIPKRKQQDPRYLQDLETV
jgi:hypothetical protein